METDNLRVSIYTAEGLVYEETAVSSESAALWNPVCLHDGTAEGLENYIYDLAQYAWATQDKNDDSYARNKEALAAYQEFLRGELPTQEGKYLLDFLADYEDGVDWDGYVDEIDYAYLDLGNDNIQELLVAFVGMDFYCADDDSTDEYILKYDEDGVKVCYEFQTWARSDTEVSYYGIVKGSGSNGATSHAKDGAVLDGEGSLIPVCSSEIQGDLSIGYMEPFHQDGIGVEGLLWDVYYGTGKYLGVIDYYDCYQISASEEETMLKELIGREYDLASLLPDSLGLELGTYYTNGDIFTYTGAIGYKFSYPTD